MTLSLSTSSQYISRYAVDFGALSATGTEPDSERSFAILSQTDAAENPNVVDYFSIGGTGNNHLIASAATPAGIYRVAIVCNVTEDTAQNKTFEVVLMEPANSEEITLAVSVVGDTELNCVLNYPASITPVSVVLEYSLESPGSEHYNQITSWVPFATLDTTAASSTTDNVKEIVFETDENNSIPPNVPFYVRVYVQCNDVFYVSVLDQAQYFTRQQAIDIKCLKFECNGVYNFVLFALLWSPLLQRYMKPDDVQSITYTITKNHFLLADEGDTIVTGQENISVPIFPHVLESPATFFSDSTQLYNFCYWANVPTLEHNRKYTIVFTIRDMNGFCTHLIHTFLTSA